MGILDTIIHTHQKESLQQFELNLIISKILDPLKDREKAILSERYGLQDRPVRTLKAIGQDQNLTRERVRQIEKELLKNLKRGAEQLEGFLEARDLLVGAITEHGGVMSEGVLLDYLGYSDESDINALKFLLNLIIDLEEHATDDYIRQSWAKLGFDKKFLKEFISITKNILDNHGQPITPQDLLEKVQQSDFYINNESRLTPQIILNYIKIANGIHTNSFGHFGLGHWSEIKPKDVGDKAYLVMKHFGKPEHYSVITELINNQDIDKRKAYKETVHNKLIKDERFVLIGRGIYALSEWGFKPGVVSDIISDILLQEKTPLSRDEIVKRVLEKRLVKKNTVLVGLSNKKLFKKVDKNLYTLS